MPQTRAQLPFTSRCIAISPMQPAPVLPLEDGPDTPVDTDGSVDGPVKVEMDGLCAGVIR